jgi:hypothetical protein
MDTKTYKRQTWVCKFMSSVGRLTESPAKNDWATTWDLKYDSVYCISKMSRRKIKPAVQANCYKE